MAGHVSQTDGEVLHTPQVLQLRRAPLAAQHVPNIAGPSNPRVLSTVLALGSKAQQRLGEPT